MTVDAINAKPTERIPWAFLIEEAFPVSLYFPMAEDCSRHTIFPGVEIAACAMEKMMLSMATFQPHAVVEEHAHPHEQVGVVLMGRAVFRIGDEEKTLEPGDLYRIPGNVPHRVVALDETVTALDIFSPIREEYL
jgi:unsaturated pyranuronate lyase